MTKYVPGDVFQINENYEKKGYVGVFVMATKIEEWGIKAFIATIVSNDEHIRTFINLFWDEIDYIGNAALKTEDMV